MADERTAQAWREDLVERKLRWDADQLRQRIIERARWVAEDMMRLANGLEEDADFGFNTLGVLQGNGVELDTWCAKLGMAREHLRLMRQARAARDEA